MTHTPQDFSPLNNAALELERQYFTAAVNFHDTELATAREGLALVEAEQAARATEKAVA